MMAQQYLMDIVKISEKRLREAKLYFGHGTDNAWDEAAYLALFALGLAPDTPLESIHLLTPKQVEAILQWIEERIRTGKPAPYLTHEAWFCGLKFYVNEHVMIPRSPIGELIMKGFSPWLMASPKNILDLCTGSGAIAIACAKAFPKAAVDAIDISGDALSVARKNAVIHQVEDQVNLIQSNLLEKIENKKYDLIISNPPYVSFEEMQTLPREYAFEPSIAFAGGGKDGLEIVDRILAQAKNHLTPEGLLIVEVGNGQQALIKRYPKIPFTWLMFEYGGQGVFLLSSY